MQKEKYKWNKDKKGKKMILSQRFGNIYPNQNQPSTEFTLLALDHAIDHLDD